MPTRVSWLSIPDLDQARYSSSAQLLPREPVLQTIHCEMVSVRMMGISEGERELILSSRCAMREVRANVRCREDMKRPTSASLGMALEGTKACRVRPAVASSFDASRELSARPGNLTVHMALETEHMHPADRADPRTPPRRAAQLCLSVEGSTQVRSTLCTPKTGHMGIWTVGSNGVDSSSRKGEVVRTSKSAPCRASRLACSLLQASCKVVAHPRSTRYSDNVRRILPSRVPSNPRRMD
ncbi:hypothetical protein FA95DRAFT_983406 [Auriscalpium vulgare]|uniref:Uncharacterized protein n=1 Tax=Auriscalpium vulgare TaxID=40419 RepID=A0ACB8R6P6_9AGAM|nr:hypothetical protein FA95DRAFT_983406 [Auriscalpium vulgare]